MTYAYEPAKLIKRKIKQNSGGKVDKLIIVRHGDYDEYSLLNDKGIGQMEGLATKFKKMVLNKSALFLTSSALRASESAKVLAKSLSLQFIEYKELWSDKNHFPKAKTVLEIIESHQDKVDILIIVTHLEYAEILPVYFGKKVLCKDWRVNEIKKGQAIEIDCQKKTLSYV